MTKTANPSHFYALIIGVGGPDIKETVNDARALNKIISDPRLAGYPAKNVYLLTEKEATKTNVEKHLDLLIKKTERTEDATIFIYYSGHGISYPGAKKNQTSYYLATHGYDQNDPVKTMVNGKTFSAKIAKIKAARMVVMLDCCYGGGMKQRTRALKAKKIKTAFSSVDFLNQLKKGKGRVFISSCADNEESAILPKAKNSLFTQVTLEVLNGKISGNDPYVKVIHLVSHLIEEVPKRLTRFRFDQHPVIVWAYDLDGRYFICLNGRRAVVRGSILKSKAAALSDANKIKQIKNYPYLLHSGKQKK